MSLWETKRYVITPDTWFCVYYDSMEGVLA